MCNKLEDFKNRLNDRYIFPDDFIWHGRQAKYALICKEHNEIVEKIPNNFIRSISCCSKYVKPKVSYEDSLFINKCPELVKEWDYEKNIDIDINKILFSSHKKVYWKCINGHSYEASLNNRTKTNNGTKCSICKYDSLRIYDKNIINNIRETYNPSEKYLNNIKIGDNSEDYIKELLINTNKFQNIETIGKNNGNADICITDFDNNKTYIQVKTLTFTKTDNYYISINSTYPDNMLIVMLNKERTHFVLDFAINIKGKRPKFNFTSTRSKYKNAMFKSIKDFTSKMVELIPKSYTNNDITKNNLLEKESLQRIENFCIKNNLNFRNNTTNCDTVDFFINGFKIQSKFISKNDIVRATYQILSQKSCGFLNNKHIKRNYEEGDFDYMIIEIGGSSDEPDKYKGNFCIISKKILIEQNILKTANCKGKKAFYICPPDYTKKHWSKNLWNNICF